MERYGVGPKPANLDEKDVGLHPDKSPESPPNDADVQVAPEQPKLQRKLKSRHLQMIAMGGAVGTGLFIGSGSALAKAGPVGSLVAYIFVGTIVYSVMVSLGEMATYIPVPGAFTAYASRFVDPSLSLAMGWIYWFSCLFLTGAITFALELSAAGIIIQYWNRDLNIGIFIAVFWVIFTSVNLLPVSFYGEIEFWFASIKVTTIVGFIIFAICIDAGAGKQGYLGFHNWAHPGPFAPYLLNSDGATAKFVGFWAVLIQAGFSYQGTELVGIAAGETANPRKTVPVAIRKTFYQILFLFCLTIFFIGLLVPYDNPNLFSSASDASASPLVIAANLAGVKGLPGLINAILLTAVLSAANSNVYSGSRIIVGLCAEGLAPKFLAKTSEGGVPYNAVAFTAVFGLLGFLNISSGGTNAFSWLLNISGVAGLISWACINLCHISFMRALSVQNLPRSMLPYKAPLQPWLAYYGLFLNVLVILTQGFTAFIPWDTMGFFVAYLSLILFVVLFVGHKVGFRTRIVRPEEADLDTGRGGVDEIVFEERVPKNVFERLWRWV